MAEGTARVVEKQRIEMITDGPCLSGTLDKLEVGTATKPMPREALARVKVDALGLLEKVLQAYDTKVARGEVGATGSSLATAADPVGGGCPTGLLYGRVQSGKTVAMITFTAAAIDNGFRVVVVLTSDFVKLVEQTADRFAALDGPLVRNCLMSESWSVDLEHLRKHIGKHGVVFICTKNQQRLSDLVDFLKDVGAANYPALVLDDEADQATLDTTVQARSSGRKNAPTQASAIHRMTVQDDEGQSIRQTLRHHAFIQVTATPYALLLQNVENELRPTFTHLIEPGAGYTGGEAFFDVHHVETESPPLVLVAEDESSVIDAGDDPLPPTGLKRAIAFFLVASGAQNLLEPLSKNYGQNFLCHTSQRTADHAKVASLIRNYVNQVTDDLERGTETETSMRLRGGYDELKKTLPEPPTFEDILERIKRRLPRREMPIVNSANSPVSFARELNFIVGGNILGRGLTIDNLLVTYYLRRAKTSQMDTVLQHARMYGYRKNLMPFTRVFLPEPLAARFHFIQNAERNLRRQLAENDGARVTVEVMANLRATRLNVLDTQSLAAYEPGGHIYPGAPDFSVRALDRFKEIKDQLAAASGGAIREGDFVSVDSGKLIELMHELPYDEDLANMWDPQMLEQLLKRLAMRKNFQAFLYCRGMSRRKTTLPTGALSGDELKMARGKPGPVLCAFYDDGRGVSEKSKNRSYWYPSLVLPSDMPTQVFNSTL
jgi:hypothetical protein